jgi:hypothetical protein
MAERAFSGIGFHPPPEAVCQQVNSESESLATGIVRTIPFGKSSKKS